MLLRYLFVPEIELLDLTNENTGNLVKFELQINKYHMGQTYYKPFIVYLATFARYYVTV